MVAAAVAETLDARFDRAEAERFVRVRLEGVADDVRAVQLDAIAVRRTAELRYVLPVLELLWNDMSGAMDGAEFDAQR